jgi:hypothetical protein
MPFSTWKLHLGAKGLTLSLSHSNNLLLMTDLSQEANTYRVALLIGAIDVDSVIAWADRQIEASTIPENELIDISLGRSSPLASIVARLGELTENTKDPRTIKNAFAIVADQVRNKLIDVECLATIVFPGWRQLEVPVDGGCFLSV